MRALHFMKIDYILTRKQLYIVPVFFILALVTSSGFGKGGTSLMVAFSYMLFVASIFSTAPFSYCVGKNRGFLLLLPASVKDRVVGRFLYGLSFVTLLSLLCGVLAGVYMLMVEEVPLWLWGISLCEMAAAIVLMVLEFLFFYLFGEGKENWQYLSNIVRVAPGMAMFFAVSALVGEVQDAAVSGTGIELEGMTGKFMQVGVAAVIVSLLLTAVAAAICVKVIEKRDYA